jgi:D-sedoheptulose 7-phosphate isomerase
VSAADLVRRSAESLAALADSEAPAQVEKLADAVSESLGNGGKVWLFGNGGSAADAQHIAAELVGRFLRDRRALPAEALTTNASILTAVANDYGFDQVFARQLEAGARAGDVAIGISTSGRSANVIAGLETAKRLGLVTAALTGESGLDADIVVAVPSSETPRIQECHAVLGHVLCELVERSLAQ